MVSLHEFDKNTAIFEYCKFKALPGKIFSGLFEAQQEILYMSLDIILQFLCFFDIIKYH